MIRSVSIMNLVLAISACGSAPPTATVPPQPAIAAADVSARGEGGAHDAEAVLAEAATKRRPGYWRDRR